MSDHLATALIVGGYPLGQRGFEFLLEATTWLKVHGGTGEAARARELCEQHRPDLILLDLDVMEGDALGLIRDFTWLHPAGRTLAMSEREDADWLGRVFQAGASGFLSKWDPASELEIGLLQLAQWPDRFVSQRLSHLLIERMKAGGIWPDGGLEVAALSAREFAVFSLAGQGLGTSATGRELGICVKTVETHQRRIREKLDLRSIDELRGRATAWRAGGGSQKRSA